MQYVSDRLFTKISGVPTVALVGPGGEKYRRYDSTDDTSILGQYRAASPEEVRRSRKANLIVGTGLSGLSALGGAAMYGGSARNRLLGAGLMGGGVAAGAALGMGLSSLLNKKKMYRLEREAGLTPASVDRYIAEHGLTPAT